MCKCMRTVRLEVSILYAYDSNDGSGSDGGGGDVTNPKNEIDDDHHKIFTHQITNHKNGIFITATTTTTGAAATAAGYNMPFTVFTEPVAVVCHTLSLSRSLSIQRISDDTWNEWKIKSTRVETKGLQSERERRRDIHTHRSPLTPNEKQKY